jgi:membrane protein implicated in regulation of membrane protease activity
MQEQTELGFIKSLFDFKMTNFITMRVIRVLYAISAVIIVIFGVIAMIAGLLGTYGGGGMKLLVVVLAPLGTLFYLIIVRLWVEFLANLYRIGDNTQKMVNALPGE